MTIVPGYPPNYDQIKHRFAVAMRPGLIFTYGDTLYVPSGKAVPPHLMAHEEVHAARQTAMGPGKWWNNYLKDTQFRLHEEVLAYRAQYQHLLAHSGRDERRSVLSQIVRDLAGPIYGNMMTKEEARAYITGAVA